MSSQVLSSQDSPRRVLFASLIGTTIEFFDFYIFATAAVLVFPRLFFPAGDPTAATLQSLATFALAFFARPVGSAIFGHFGDRIGRKATLVAALLMMGASTVLIGLLPTYASIGVAAPLLLAVCRLGQGLGLGGEWGGAVLLAIENAPPGRRAWYGMFPQLGAPIGFFCSTGIFLVLSNWLDDAQFLAFGWRIPFLASAVLVWVGLYVRLKLTETPVFRRAMQNDERVRLPLLAVCAQHTRALLLGTFIALSTFALFYLLTVFALSWATSELRYTRTDFLVQEMIGVLFFAIGIPLSALTADRYGARAVLIVASLAIFGFGLAFAPLFASTTILGAIPFLALGFFLMGLTYGPLGTALSDLFPTAVRYTGSSLSFNLAGILGASLAPYIATWLATNHGLAYVGYYLAFAATLTLFALLLMESRARSVAGVNANDREIRCDALVDEARQRLAEITFPSTLAACLYYLRDNPNDGMGWYERRPFITFLMLKWAAELWDPMAERREGVDADFNFIQEKIWDAIGLLHEPRPSILLRRRAFQQFWYQRGFQISSIPRQAMLFGNLMARSDVVRAFVAEVGIEPKDFVRQLARMASQIGQAFGFPELAQLRPEPSERDAHDWPLMAQFLIVDPRGLHDRMVALARYRTPRAVELCEQTPLIRTPFLTTRRGDECIHHQVLYQAIAGGLYDILRDRGAEVFMRVFSPAFEGYIGAVLDELPYEVVRENELQELLQGDGKCVDFALVSDDALLLIDAKGIEGHYDERYHNLSEVLTEKLRTTALYAADQAIGTVTRLPEDLRRPITVFICVTYKQLNIGDGDALRDLTHGTKEWDHARWHDPNLPPSHMFTISIHEFELLCGVLRRRVPLAQVFEQVLRDNQAPETSKFLFEQHMAPYGQVDIPNCSRMAAYELCGIA